MNHNKTLKIFIILLIVIAIFMIFYFCQNFGNEYTPINTQSTSLDVKYSDGELTGEWSNYVAKITLDDTNTLIEGSGVTHNANTVKINSAGTYYITGSISDGNILIEAAKDAEVQLVLDNVSITSQSTAPINCVECSKLTITLADNSENVITDSEAYKTFTDTEKSEPDGAIFTKTDLVINGNGTLNVNANYLDGIVSKDGLKILNSNIVVNSKDDSIRGKDYVAINQASIHITSGGDGIKSTNDEDSSLGYIAIEGGDITIHSEADGIQAETILNISSNPTINIQTTGEIASSNNINSDRNGFKGGYVPIANSTSATDSSSSKGLKAGNEITIENGNIEITSTDDSIHSNGIIVMNNGNIKSSSGDDGIHADTNIVINNGNIDIAKSYEGIESSYIEINNGTISVTASDDGINVSGENDSSAINGRQGQNSFNQVQSSDRKLVINGGDIFVDATGDGLDANGSIYINGGNVIVAGTTSTGNGALDYDMECVVTAGNLMIYGGNNMWQNPSSNSTQYILTYQASGNSGDEISLKDSSGKEIASFKTEKSYGVITISNENITKGNSYTLYVNGTSVGSLEVDDIITSNAALGGLNMRGGEKGMRPPR